MSMVKQRQLSPLQKKILALMLNVESRTPGPVPARDIERTLACASIHYSCYSMSASGLMHTTRGGKNRLLVELTDAGREAARPLLSEEYQVSKERQREGESRVLPFRPQKEVSQDVEVDIRGRWYTVSRAAFIVRLDGSVSLALWSINSGQAWLNGDALEVAEWYQACYDAGLPVRVQVNDS